MCQCGGIDLKATKNAMILDYLKTQMLRKRKKNLFFNENIKYIYY